MGKPNRARLAGKHTATFQAAVTQQPAYSGQIH
jgi:hypothetical protein